MNVTRQELAKLVADMLAIRTGIELGLFPPPDPSQMTTLLQNTTEAADQLLDSFSDGILKEKIQNLIVTDVRSALLKRTRLSAFVGWGLAITPFTAAVIVGVAQFLFVTPVSIEAVKVVFWIILVLLILQFIGFAYLKYLDRD